MRSRAPPRAPAAGDRVDHDEGIRREWRRMGVRFLGQLDREPDRRVVEKAAVDVAPPAKLARARRQERVARKPGDAPPEVRALACAVANDVLLGTALRAIAEFPGPERKWERR